MILEYLEKQLIIIQNKIKIEEQLLNNPIEQNDDIAYDLDTVQIYLKKTIAKLKNKNR